MGWGGARRWGILRRKLLVQGSWNLMTTYREGDLRLRQFNTKMDIIPSKGVSGFWTSCYELPCCMERKKSLRIAKGKSSPLLPSVESTPNRYYLHFKYVLSLWILFLFQSDPLSSLPFCTLFSDMSLCRFMQDTNNHLLCVVRTRKYAN